jgi:hypothetical protein
MVTVIGKGFYDIDHSGKTPTRNRRNYDSSFSSLGDPSGDEADTKATLSWQRRRAAIATGKINEPSRG